MGTLFALAKGSDGAGPESWTLWIPMQLDQAHSPSDDSHGAEFELLGYPTRVLVMESFQALQVGGIGTQDEAKALLPRLLGALMWASASGTMGALVSPRTAEVEFFAEPVPADRWGWDAIDGTYDGKSVVVLPNHMRLQRIEMGSARAVVRVTPVKLASLLNEALEWASPEILFEDGRLRLACVTYASSHHQVDPRARLLNLVTVLEILSERQEVSGPERIACDAAIDAARAVRDTHPKASDAWKGADATFQRVMALHQESIGRAVRRLVRTVAEQSSDAWDPDTSVKTVKAVYETRSSLVHGDSVQSSDLKAHLDWLTRFVPAALGCNLRVAAGGQSVSCSA